MANINDKTKTQQGNVGFKDKSTGNKGSAADAGLKKNVNNKDQGRRS